MANNVMARLLEREMCKSSGQCARKNPRAHYHLLNLNIAATATAKDVLKKSKKPGQRKHPSVVLLKAQKLQMSPVPSTKIQNC